MENQSFSISSENRNATRLDVKARQFKIVVDDMPTVGGKNEGANPAEYILAGYAGWLNVVANSVAKELGIILHKLAIEITGELNPSKAKGKHLKEQAGFQSINVHLEVYSNTNENILNKWLKILKKRCPIGNNLANPRHVQISLNQYVSAN